MVTIEPLAPFQQTINSLHGLGLTIAALSSLFWTLTYVLVIWRGNKDRTFAMPLTALAANLSWEVIFLVITLTHDPFDARLALILPWTLLESAIVVQCFRYGKNDFSQPFIVRHFPLGLSGIIFCAFTIILFTIREFKDALGWYVAFGQNLMMSVLFVAMLFRRNSSRGQSIGIAVCKFLGSFFAFLFALFWSPVTLHEHWTSLLPSHYTPISPLLVTLYLGIFAFDLLYIVLLYKIKGAFL